LPLDPCKSAFADHVAVSHTGEISHKTPEGHALIKKLVLDSPDRTAWRSMFISLVRGLADRTDAEGKKIFTFLMGFPTELPDLASLRPPEGNTKPKGLEQAYFTLREKGTLPETY